MSKDQHYFEINVPSVEKSREEDINLEETLTIEKEIFFWELIFPNFKIKSFTFIITSIQVLFFLITWLYYIAMDSAWECVLYKFGAGFEPAIRHNFEIHRLFLMPMFLHYDLNHMIGNMIMQAMILFHLEACYPKKIVIGIYFFSNLGGSILSNMVYLNLIKIGASFSIFGCFAFEIISLINKHHEIIFKSRARFTLACLFCGILSFPILRVYDNRAKIKTLRLLKIILFYGGIIFYNVIYIVMGVNAGIDKEMVNNKVEEDENFHWLRLLTNSKAIKKPNDDVVVDNVGHLG